MGRLCVRWSSLHFLVGGGGVERLGDGLTTGHWKSLRKKPLRRSPMCRGRADTVGKANIMMISILGLH